MSNFLSFVLICLSCVAATDALKKTVVCNRIPLRTKLDPNNLFTCFTGQTCCAENGDAACCEQKPMEIAKWEQIQLWGSVALLILILALVMFCCRHDGDYCCNRKDGGRYKYGCCCACLSPIDYRHGRDPEDDLDEVLTADKLNRNPIEFDNHGFNPDKMNQRARSPSMDQENNLKFKSQQKLHTVTDPTERLRLLCLARGASGVIGFGKVFRRMDKDNSMKLSETEFIQGLTDTGMHLNESQSKELFQAYDTDATGSIDYQEFLHEIRPPMSASRVKLIESAYEKMDINGDGTVTAKDLQGVYNVSKNPQYLSGDLTEEQILNNYLNKFEGNTTTNGTITLDEFLDYYSGVSASIDKDSYFHLMMQNSWDIE